MEGFVYTSPYSDKPIEMELQISRYLNTGGIYVGLFTMEENFPEPYGDITVNLGTVPDYCGFLDVNNLPGIAEFVEKNDLARPLNILLPSGFCCYPLYEFNKEKLRELCPEGMKEYEQAVAKARESAKVLPLQETKGR